MTNPNAARGARFERDIRALAAAVAAAAGLVAFAAPANAATGARAVVKHGILTVTGTATRDIVDVTLNADNATVDFGFDGTIDAQFPRTRIKQVQVLGVRATTP